jgi:hypothetical protein
MMKTSASKDAAPPAQRIDERIAELGDWRGPMLARLRALVKEAVPEVVEEWKWSNPVWSYHGIICTGETYKKVVKMTFAKGASVPDPGACSTPASKATCGARSISTRVRRSTRRR